MWRVLATGRGERNEKKVGGVWEGGSGCFGKGSASKATFKNKKKGPERLLVRKNGKGCGVGSGIAGEAGHLRDGDEADWKG